MLTNAYAVSGSTATVTSVSHRPGVEITGRAVMSVMAKVSDRRAVHGHLLSLPVANRVPQTNDACRICPTRVGPPFHRAGVEGPHSFARIRGWAYSLVGRDRNCGIVLTVDRSARNRGRLEIDEI